MFAKAFRAVVMLTLFCSLSLAREDQSAKVSAAQKSAEQWLNLLDSGEFERSWNEAADSFRAAVTLEQWRRAMTSVRQPLGKLHSRTLAKATYTEEAPGAPDGEYVVIRYNASFEHKQSAQETITPKFENGQWKVSGYFVK